MTPVVLTAAGSLVHRESDDAVLKKVTAVVTVVVIVRETSSLPKSLVRLVPRQVQATT